MLVLRTVGAFSYERATTCSEEMGRFRLHGSDCRPHTLIVWFAVIHMWWLSYEFTWECQWDPMLKEWFIDIFTLPVYSARLIQVISQLPTNDWISAFAHSWSAEGGKSNRKLADGPDFTLLKMNQAPQKWCFVGLSFRFSMIRFRVPSASLFGWCCSLLGCETELRNFGFGSSFMELWSFMEVRFFVGFMDLPTTSFERLVLWLVLPAMVSTRAIFFWEDASPNG